jgi:hypothetical protein
MACEAEVERLAESDPRPISEVAAALDLDTDEGAARRLRRTCLCSLSANVARSYATTSGTRVTGLTTTST